MALLGMAHRVLVWLHGRRLGIVGDSLGGSSSSLVLDGITIGSTRAPILLAHLGHNGVGAVAVAGAVVGDNVVGVTNLSAPGDVTASFETTVTVAGQVQQSAVTDLSAAVLLFSLQPQS